MDGVFINLTDKNVELVVDNKTITILANPDLVTPIKELVLTENTINAFLSTPLKEDDIRYLQGTGWINTLYNKITRSEEEIKTKILTISPYVKYPFTQEQIDKINKISNKRTRLLITTKEDVQYWAYGKFECPFRNYRLFVHENNSLLEYPIPKTYLDAVVEGVKKIGNKFISSTT
jgi:hypothetical protein